MAVNVRHSVEMASLHQQTGIKISSIVKQLKQYSPATVYRHCKKPFTQTSPIDKHRFNRGRPSKLTPQDKHSILRSVPKLRQSDGSFTSPRVAMEAGVADKVHGCTVRRVLNTAGYHYCRSIKKGLLRAADLNARLDFCKNIRKRKLGQIFWNNHVATYLDSKGFQYKTQPLDQARAPSAREWRKRNEGLKFGCTAKGTKEGSINVNFVVGISQSKGVVLCHHYKKALTADKMVQIIETALPEAFDESVDSFGRRVLADGCPRQNSKEALKTLEDVGALVFKITPRSPDLNPIENFFTLVTRTYRKQVIEKNIVRETYDEFVTRVRETMRNFSIPKIDRIIESMDKKITLIMKSKGCRIKY